MPREPPSPAQLPGLPQPASHTSPPRSPNTQVAASSSWQAPSKLVLSKRRDVKKAGQKEKKKSQDCPP